MPRGDRTGPVGQGPETGRMLGFCSDHETPGFTRGSRRGICRDAGYGPRAAGRGTGPRAGRGAGRGVGRGAGRGVSGGIG